MLGKISVPDQGLQDVDLQDLNNDDRGISFQITTKLGVLPFHAEFLGNRMIGEVSVRGRELVCVFERKEN